MIDSFVLSAVTLLLLQGRTEPVPSLPPDETITIRGLVTDRETGHALPRARVSVYSGAIDLKRPPVALTQTDDAGAYELAGLPRSAFYLVLAQPPPHVSSHLAQLYGFEGPFDPAAPLLVRAKPLEPLDFANANISLSRALAIEGRVLNDEGDPVAGMQVVLLRAERPTWRSAVRLTDDRGAFRQFGLAPGRYRICASAPSGEKSTSLQSLRRTCYPASDMEALELGTTSIGGLDIRLTRGKRATIAGVVQDASGAPGDRTLIQFIENDDPSRTSLPVEQSPGGRFVIREVEPGTYRLFAATPSGPDDRDLRERVTIPVVVDRDIDDLVVRTRAAATISGFVTFETAPPAEGATRLGVIARNDGPAFPIQPSRVSVIPAAVKSDWSFRLDGVFQETRLGIIGLPAGWIVRSITYRGRDITDLPVDFEGPIDPHPITIVVTRRR